MKKKLLIFLMMLLWLAPKAQAQCTFRNTAFKNGEFLTYNLYYNWKFVWVKAGTASWYVVNSTYKGTPAYRCSLTTKATGGWTTTLCCATRCCAITRTKWLRSTSVRVPERAEGIR